MTPDAPDSTRATADNPLGIERPRPQSLRCELCRRQEAILGDHFCPTCRAMLVTEFVAAMEAAAAADAPVDAPVEVPVEVEPDAVETDATPQTPFDPGLGMYIRRPRKNRDRT